MLRVEALQHHHREQPGRSVPAQQQEAEQHPRAALESEQPRWLPGGPAAVRRPRAPRRREQPGRSVPAQQQEAALLLAARSETAVPEAGSAVERSPAVDLQRLQPPIFVRLQIRRSAPRTPHGCTRAHRERFVVRHRRQQAGEHRRGQASKHWQHAEELGNLSWRDRGLPKTICCDARDMNAKHAKSECSNVRRRGCDHGKRWARTTEQKRAASD